MERTSDYPMKPGDTVKEKASGDVYYFNQLSTSFAYGTSNVTLLDKEGKRKVIDYDNLLKQYERVIPDFSRLAPNLIDQVCMDENTLLFRELEKIARRLHPGGYFKEGCYVYVVNPNALYSRRGYDSDRVEADKPYRIEKIEVDHQFPLLYNITIVPVYWNINSTVIVPMYLDRFTDVDAFTCLRRYDMPY